MLQKLNERIQGLVAWIIIVLVAITFTLFGVDYYMQSHHESSAQVDVNGQPISKQAFELSYRRTRQSREPGQLTAASERELKQQLLNEMIVNSVSVQSARTNGFEVSSAQADAAIVSIPQFQEDGHFSSGRYTQALNGAFFTPESFQNEVRQGMLLNQQRFALIGSSFALPEEINQFVKLYMQTRDYVYLRIPAQQFLKQNDVSEKDIGDYYQLHRKEFLAPEQVSISYIRLSLKDVKNTIKLSESDLKRYYDENQSTFIKPYSEVKSDIQQQILAELAQKKYAEKLEKLSDLSYQTPDTLTSVAKLLELNSEESEFFTHAGGKSLLLKNKQVVDAAFSHDVLELGNNSEPVQLDNDSVVVLRVKNHRPAAEKSLQEVKPLIFKILTQKQAVTKAQHIATELLDNHVTAIQKAELISKYKLKWQEVRQASRETEESPASINELAFALPRVGEKTGNQLDNGVYVIVSLNAIHEGKLDSMDKEQISSITQQIEANYGVMDYELYVNGLMSKAEIVKH